MKKELIGLLNPRAKLLSEYTKLDAGSGEQWDTNLDRTQEGGGHVHSPATHSKLGCCGSKLQTFINRSVSSETIESRDTHSHVFLNRRSRTRKVSHPNAGLIVQPEHPKPINYLRHAVANQYLGFTEGHQADDSPSCSRQRLAMPRSTSCWFPDPTRFEGTAP